MKNKQIEPTLKLGLMLLFICINMISCNKKAIENGLKPGKKLEFKERITVINTNKNNSLAVIMHTPELGLNIFTFGKKNEEGNLTKMEGMMFSNPVDTSWFYVTFENIYPSRIRTSKNIITTFSNYNRANLSCDIQIKDASGKIITNKISEKFSIDFFEGFENTAKALSSNNARRNNILETECEKGKRIAGALGFAGNAISCGLGVATIAESAGIALFLNGVSTLVACYNALATLANKIDSKITKSKEKLLPEFTCGENLANDGIGLAGLAAGTGPPSLVSVGLAAAGTAIDADACEDCPKDSPKVPKSSGDPHIYTHDGAHIPFQGHGEFIAVKSTTDNFEIQARQEAWFDSKNATVNTGVAIKTAGNDVIAITVNPLKIFLNKSLLNENFGQKKLNDGSLLIKNDAEIRIETKQGDQIVVNTYFNYLDYSVIVAPNRAQKVKGLMGNYDGNEINDLALSNGKVVENTFENLYPTFADSWRITQNNSLFEYEIGKSTSNYTIKNYPSNEIELTLDQISIATNTCKTAGVNIQPFLNECIYDVAITGNNIFTKSTLVAQKFIFIPNIPSGNIGSDINYFPKVRLEINSESQSDLSQLNLINWKTGKVYALKDGTANAAIIDAVALAVGGNNYLSIYPTSTLDECGSSCGVGTINNVIDSQKWAVTRKGTIENKFGINQENSNNPNFVSASKWPTLLKASDLAAVHKPLALDINEKLNFATLVESQNSDFPDTPYSNSLFRFITQEGKKGAFIISGFGKIPGTDKYYLTIDIKIEK
jgi:hypothetical protein